MLTRPLVALLVALSAESVAAQTPADVTFMQGMIVHHGQALAMARMIPSRTSRQDFALMSERIIVSQKDEIDFMTAWLREHKAAVPMLEDDTKAHAMHMEHGSGHGDHAADSAMHHAMMPGMLTPEEMTQLAKLSGAAFEQQFLKGMIRHHQGAIQMVKSLLSTKGGAQDANVARFANEVDADQSAEIARMQKLLQPTQ